VARIDGLVHDVLEQFPISVSLDVFSKGTCAASIEGIRHTSDMRRRNHILLKEWMFSTK
jgi:hypothetical protein